MNTSSTIKPEHYRGGIMGRYSVILYHGYIAAEERTALIYWSQTTEKYTQNHSDNLLSLFYIMTIKSNFYLNKMKHVGFKLYFVSFI